MIKITSAEQYENLKQQTTKKLFVAMYGCSSCKVEEQQVVMQQLDLHAMETFYGNALFVFVDVDQMKIGDMSDVNRNQYTFKIFAKGKLLHQTDDYNRVYRLCTKYSDKIAFNMAAN